MVEYRGEPTALLDDEAPAHWVSPVELPMVIVVGVTGVGKSTTLEHLGQRLRCAFLPDRREVADRVVFPTLQDDAGEPRRPVRDRVERFRLTARWRERHPGGMAEALSRLRVDPAVLDRQLVFDGLRGSDEIEWAISHLPRTRFLALRAPEVVRLARLLGRDQAFDHTERREVGAVADGEAEALLAGVPGLDAVMPRRDLDRLLESPAVAGVALEEIAGKAAILVEEARNYDPAAAVRVLETQLGPWRHLVVDTAAHGPGEVAARVAEWLDRPQ
jgi:hypothetical protein